MSRPIQHLRHQRLILTALLVWGFACGPGKTAESDNKTAGPAKPSNPPSAPDDDVGVADPVSISLLAEAIAIKTPPVAQGTSTGGKQSYSSCLLRSNLADQQALLSWVAGDACIAALGSPTVTKSVKYRIAGNKVPIDVRIDRLGKEELKIFICIDSKLADVVHLTGMSARGLRGSVAFSSGSDFEGAFDSHYSDAKVVTFDMRDIWTVPGVATSNKTQSIFNIVDGGVSTTTSLGLLGGNFFSYFSRFNDQYGVMRRNDAEGMFVFDANGAVVPLANRPAAVGSGGALFVQPTEVVSTFPADYAVPTPVAGWDCRGADSEVNVAAAAVAACTDKYYGNAPESIACYPEVFADE